MNEDKLYETEKRQHSFGGARCSLVLILSLKCSIMPLRYVVFFRALTEVNYNLITGLPSS